MRRYPYQHMHVVAIDRSSVDGHLVRSRDFPQQLPRPLPDISTQHRKPVLRYPHDMILAVPDRVTSGLRILHTRSVASQSPKGEGFTDPKGGTLNKHLQYREIVIHFGDLRDASEKYEIPIMATWDFDIADLMRHFLPWLDYDYYEDPDDGGTGEVEQHVLQVSLSKPAKAFLELERFFAEPWLRDSGLPNDGEEFRRRSGPHFFVRRIAREEGL